MHKKSDDILKFLGLTEGEIKIYNTLIKKPQSTASELSKETGLSRSNLYRMLDSLTTRGLIYLATQNNVSHFSITYIERLKELYDKKILDFKSKERDVEKFIRENKNKGDPRSSIFSVEVYDGIKEIQSNLTGVLDLKKNDIVYAFGKEGVLSPYKGLRFWMENLIKKRIKKKVIFKGIFNWHENSKAADSKLTSVKYTDLKEMGNLHIAVYASTTNIYLTEEKRPKVVSIKNESIAKGMKQYFRLLEEKALDPQNKKI